MKTQIQLVYLVKDTVTGYRVLTGTIHGDIFKVVDKSKVNLKLTTKLETLHNDVIAANKKVQELSYLTN